MKKSIMLFAMIIVGVLLSACGQGTLLPEEKGEENCKLLRRIQLSTIL